MILLIGMFILSSALLLKYALEKGGETEEGQVNFAALLTQGKALADELREKGNIGDEQADEQLSDESEPGARKLFGGSSSVRWPKLKLTGFGRAADGEGGFAIINGDQVLLNNYIDDVKLVEIRAHGAVVEYKGEQKLLTVDHTQ